MLFACVETLTPIEGRDWGGKLYEHYKEMSRAAGVRKAARDRREDIYDPERKDNTQERATMPGSEALQPLLRC